MKHPLLLAAAVSALCLAGCKKDTTTSPDAGATVSAPDAGMAPSTMAAASPAQAFANDAAASDAFEIQSSQMAADKAQSAKVKAFAKQMIKAHTDSTAQLQSAASQASPAITPDPQLNAMQQQMLTDLGGKSGADFDRAYIAAQTQAHQMTLDKLKSYAGNGDQAPLKAFATKLVPIVTAHLNMAKAM